MKNFNNKIIYITGGSSGIGLATAKEFIKYGASVLLISRNVTKLEAARNLLSKEKDQNETNIIEICPLDISKNKEVKKALSEQLENFGIPDILINCAGMAYPDYFEKIPFNSYEKTIATNLTGTWNVLSSLVPMMKKGSHIVNVSSIGGFIGVFGFTAYSASKFAVVGLSEALRGELKPKGIRVSVLCPPDTDTPGMEEENKTKPEETHAISGNVKLVSTDNVAKALVKGIKTNKFMIIPGFMGKLTFILKRFFPSLIFAIMDSDVRKIDVKREKQKK
ncbi:MAG: SDR family oxidoreductase [Spirochaetales bacterium]|nr:SDR family oxidoreductase [Spirochaetales bacterium]